MSERTGPASSHPFLRAKEWILLGVVCLISYFTYFRGYSNPPNLFWDENYHIASAQKYLNHVYFMENHPPMGKLLIALGEKISHANARDDQFLGTDYGRTLPPTFSFRGYRFFPALLAWLAAPLLFLIFLAILEDGIIALSLSSLYVFDNTLIVHSRSAMIEGSYDFFLILMIAIFFWLSRKVSTEPGWKWLSLALGVSFGLLLTSKVIGAITIFIVPAILWEFRRHGRHVLQFLGYFFVGAIVIYVAVWQIHFSLGKNIDHQLDTNGYYLASEKYREALDNGKSGSLSYFPLELRDSLRWVSNYNSGVPVLNLCKPDENGSPFYYWPFGARAINYRWETPDGISYRYLYLQCNPAGWFFGLIGVLLGSLFVIAPLVIEEAHVSPRYALLCLFVGMYACYMIAISRLGRVMYLYHYFTPLIFSFIIVGLVLAEIQRFGPWRLDLARKQKISVALAIVVFATFRFYSPLTYYRPLTDQQFNRRALLSVWNLHPVNGPNTDPSSHPLPPQKVPYYITLPTSQKSS